jgi:hypothetical protein
MAYFLESVLHDSYTSLIMLVMFNLLFDAIIFHLNGDLTLKLGVMAAGNFFGLCWNYFLVFSSCMWVPKACFSMLVMFCFSLC